MLDLDHLKDIALATPTKIVLLVLDGLGGLPESETGRTELEAAKIPNLDRLASEGICGMIDPVGLGITPGSGPGHLALFGYDPVKFLIGRGVLETLGIGFDLGEKDVAARGNFCTVDEQGLVVDRRAGRISTEEAAQLCQLLNELEVNGIEIFVKPVKEHRFAVVFRGDGLSPELTDSDPQREGMPPIDIAPLSPEAKNAAERANEFVAKARVALSRHTPANMVLLRGFSCLPSLPGMGEIYKLRPAAIAAYPMYRGLAKIVGMEVLEVGSTGEDEFDVLARNYDQYDFFFVHIKGTDKAGEDGDFEGKVRVLEEVDALLPRLLSLNPDVLAVTGDHSTPAVLRGHSWHPVPFLLHSQWCRPDGVREFSERACSGGALGRFPATEIMPLAMANALKLTKFGA